MTVAFAMAMQAIGVRGFLLVGGCFLWLGALAGVSHAQLGAQLGPRGEILELKVADTVYLRDVGVTLIKPGWGGSFGDQRALDPASVTATERDGATVYEATVSVEGAVWELRETARVTPEALTVDYEITPQTEITVETILGGGLIPTDIHAGRTRYIAAGVDSVAEGLCPAELNDPGYAFLSGRGMEWLGLVGPNGTALRVTPTDISLGMQDNRKWNTQAFQLMAATGQGRLAAGNPTRFGLTFAADTAERLEADARAIRDSSVAGLELSDDRPLRIGDIRLDRTRVGAYEPVELRAEVEATYDNPFSPDDITVDAQVVGPGGAATSVPGFFYVPLELSTKGDSEYLRRVGPPDFRIRFAPPAPGEYEITLVVRDRSGEVRSEPIAFTAEPSDSPGFVRVAKGAPQHFAFDGGQPYFAIGENVCWAWAQSPLRRYDEWLRGLGAAGGNWARLWLSFNEKGLEWMPNPTEKGGYGAYRGLGRYALDNAWRLDEVFRIATESGVYLMPCLGTYGEFTEGGYFNEGSWVSNPYNVKNGGPCATPADFWTNEEARKLYRQRLRYLIARWGYATHLFAWEFWNEVPPSPEQVAWVAEMAAYIKQTDPNRHLVSTTYGSGDTWACPDVDFAMAHMYGSAGNIADFTPMIVDEAARQLASGKPYLLAEFGIDWQSSDSKWDPKGTGLNMHNGAWASVMSGAAGTSMLWYWDGYVHPNNLYHVLTPIKRFADTVDWSHTSFTALGDVEVTQPADAPEVFTDLLVPSTVEWGRSPSAEYTIRHDGTVEGAPVARTVGSPKRADPNELHQQLAFHVDMPQAGQVIVRLGFVSNSARLQILLDGEMKVDRPLATGEAGAGPWKEARWLDQYKLWQCRYDEDIPIDVPAGEHALTIRNADGDWLQIPEIRLPAYRSSRYPNVNTVGLTSDRLVLLWLHNKESTWRTEFEDKQPATLSKLQLRVPVPAGGQWRVEWWDTFTGEIVQRDTVESANGALALSAPDLARDLALRAER